MNKEYTKEILLSRLESYKKFHSSSSLHKKIRKPNFPEDISENIVKNFLEFETTWKEKTGDLFSKKFGKIEIKCFSSDGHKIRIGTSFLKYFALNGRIKSFKFVKFFVMIIM